MTWADYVSLAGFLAGFLYIGWDTWYTFWRKPISRETWRLERKRLRSKEVKV